MTIKTFGRHKICALASLGIAFTLVAHSANAGTFMWGDLSDPAGDVMYLDVTENHAEANPNPFFDQHPDDGGPDVVGNQIMFDPQNFLAGSTSGSPDPDNFVDSQMSTTIMAKPGKGITGITVQEAGDFSLGGAPGGSASAMIGAAFFMTILEVDGAPITPIADNKPMTFTGGGSYSRPADDGLAQIWEGTIDYDLVAILADNNVPGTATKVSLTFDNSLFTSSDATSFAFIKKKEIGGGVMVDISTNNIPEPATVALAALSLVGMVATRRWATQG